MAVVLCYAEHDDVSVPFNRNMNRHSLAPFPEGVAIRLPYTYCSAPFPSHSEGCFHSITLAESCQIAVPKFAIFPVVPPLTTPRKDDKVNHRQAMKRRSTPGRKAARRRLVQASLTPAAKASRSCGAEMLRRKPPLRAQSAGYGPNSGGTADMLLFALSQCGSGRFCLPRTSAENPKKENIL